jgi:hypothetical protein
MNTDQTAAPTEMPLTDDDIKIGTEIFVYNHERGTVICRGTVQSPVWYEAKHDTAPNQLLINMVGKVLIRDEKGNLAPHYTGDMGLTLYESGVMNPTNRTYRA